MNRCRESLSPVIPRRHLPNDLSFARSRDCCRADDCCTGLGAGPDNCRGSHREELGQLAAAQAPAAFTYSTQPYLQQAQYYCNPYPYPYYAYPNPYYGYAYPSYGYAYPYVSPGWVGDGDGAVVGTAAGVGAGTMVGVAVGTAAVVGMAGTTTSLSRVTSASAPVRWFIAAAAAQL
jgi:hypothetical protein